MRFPPYRFALVLGVLLPLLLYLLFTLGVGAQKSAHFDEAAHLASGYYANRYDDFRLATGNLILGQRLAALGLVGDAVAPPPERLRNAVLNAQRIDPDQMGKALLYLSGNNPQHLLLRARMPIALLAAITGLGIFLWSRRIFGNPGGIVSLAFFAVSPTLIAFGGIVGADLPAASLLFFTVWAFWALLHRVTPPTVAAFGASAGLLLLSKLSALAFGPVALALLLARFGFGGRSLNYGWGWRADRKVSSPFGVSAALAGALIGAFAIVLAVIWAGYGFRFSAAPADAVGSGLAWWMYDEAKGPLITLIRAALSGHWLPEPFLFDLAALALLVGGRQAYFFGEVGVDGWIGYFPFTFFAKSNPMVILGLGVLALVGIVQWRRARRRGASVPAWLYESIPALAFIAIFGAIACLSALNIGHRHILPLYPFVFLLLGGLGRVFASPKRWPKVGVGLLLAGGLTNALFAYPNPLGYISPLVGGERHGYEMVVDSSLEWGQELPALRAWLDARPEERSGSKGHGPYFSYFGSGIPEAYGIRTQRLFGFFQPEGVPDEPLGAGTYLISATMLEPLYYIRASLVSPQAIGAIGPWCRPYEQMYRLHAPVAAAYFRARNDAAAEGGPALDVWMQENIALVLDLYRIPPASVAGIDAGAIWRDFLRNYDLFRLGRLTHLLRTKEPAEVIGASILVYRLTEEDIRTALDSPLDDLPSEPIIRGAEL